MKSGASRAMNTSCPRKTPDGKMAFNIHWEEWREESVNRPSKGRRFHSLGATMEKAHRPLYNGRTWSRKPCKYLNGLATSFGNKKSKLLWNLKQTGSQSSSKIEKQWLPCGGPQEKALGTSCSFQTYFHVDLTRPTLDVTKACVIVAVFFRKGCDVGLFWGGFFN